MATVEIGGTVLAIRNSQFAIWEWGKQFAIRNSQFAIRNKPKRTLRIHEVERSAYAIRNLGAGSLNL
ncbi:MAG: hypothetical protein KME64_05430 [Scytonematopsis contorta HA4267-MV1]|nr:hypothetical protein [Scytonematopsis contorta HA4267-MV1]